MQRIASFLASGTEIVAALGLGARVVAISHECDFPAALLDRPRLSRPRFDPESLSSGGIDAAVRAAMQEHGSVYRIDEALLAEVQPDLVLAQAVCEVCAVPTAGVRDAVARVAPGARVLSLDAHTLEDILQSIRAVGAAAEAEPQAIALEESLRARLAAVRERVAGRVAPRVLALEWLDPPFAPGHWVPEMIEHAGGRCVVGRAGGHSEQVSWETLDPIDPDVLVIMPCGYGLVESRAEADRFRALLERVAQRAIHAGRAWVVDGSSYFNRSGPRVVHGVEILAALLHPRSGAPGEAAGAARWP